VHNEAAWTDFDWDAVASACDGELAQATADMSEEERKGMAEALAQILSWVFHASAYPGRAKTIDAAVGRRAFALALHVCPSAIPSRTKAGMARRLGIKRQSMTEMVGKARRRFPLD